LLLGVNGVGKTTSAAKLASLYSREGKTILAAADTFRAAAIEQLKIHGERLGIRVIAQKHNSDPAAVLHDAMEAAIHGKYLALVADTAGRMHTRAALIGELTKISRVIEGGAGEGRLVYRKFLVLDATTGGNALAQAETFNEAVKLDGVILTKFDSTARGGVVFPLAVNLKLPVVYVCDGERYEDIHEFNAESFVKEFLG
jgi:fused signal recognition particle receptor